MLNTAFYRTDDILTAIDIHPSFNDIFECTTLTDSTINEVRQFKMDYTPNYPTIMDSTIVDSSNVIVHADYIEFLPDTTTIIDIVLSDEYMKLSCDDLCSEDYKFKMNDFVLSISKTLPNTANQIFFNTSKNQFTDNAIIYDYILNPTYGTTIYNSRRLELIPKKELIGYVEETDLPEYAIKCIDDQGVISYHKISLEDMGLTTNTGIVTSTFYDLTTAESDTLGDTILTSCKTLYILMSTTAFKMYFQSLRELHTSVSLLIKVKNLIVDDSIFISKNQLYFNWYRGCTYYFSIGLKNNDTMVDYSSWFLTRGMYAKFNSVDLMGIMKEELDNVEFKMNDTLLTVQDLDTDKSLLESNNYLVQNNTIRYVPLGFHKDTDGGNIFSITIKDQIATSSFVMYPDLIITLMRQMVPHNQTQPFYNPNNCSININDFKYVVSKDRVDITNTSTNYDHITALKFNTTINNIIGIHTSDITSILNDLDQDLKVNVFLRKLSTLQSLIYVQFKNDSDMNYLRRFITTNITDLILENIILSITRIDGRYNNIIIEMLKPTPPEVIRYTDETGTTTYIYAIKDMEVLSINGVYNRKVIESNYADNYKNDCGYYVPDDVIIISNNKT